MTSRILRRSGVAVVNMSRLLDWKPDLVIQVGVGHYHQEVDVMKEVWPGVRLFGFEPDPTIYPSLKKTYPGRIVTEAIGDTNEDSQTFFHKHRHTDGSSLLGLSPGRRYTQVSVTTITLDRANHVYDIINGDRQRVLLWLDCEGSELAALRGGRETLKRVDVVNVEMTGKPPSPNWPSSVEVHNELIDAGFLRQSVHTNRSVAGQCDAIYVCRSLFKPELCCCPCMLGGKGCTVSST